MAHILEQLLEVLLKAARHSGEALPHLIPSLAHRVVQAFQAAALPETILLFVASMGLVTAVVGTFAATHLLLLSRRQGRVFVSYQHDRAPDAKALANAMKKENLEPLLLPFLENPEHDDLLDKVKTSIVDADLIVCLPGVRSSFVEHEVSMAFGLNKPMVFLLNADEESRLPNTAKHGLRFPPLFGQVFI